MIRLQVIFIYMMFTSILHASFNTKEVVTVNGTTIEITKDCQLYVTPKNEKRELTPFMLDKFNHCSIMKEIKKTPFIVQIPEYGDTLFTIQSIEITGMPLNLKRRTNTNYIMRFVTILVTQEKGKVYFSKFDQAPYDIGKESWQLRIISARIRRAHNLDAKLLEVKHTGEILAP